MSAADYGFSALFTGVLAAWQCSKWASRPTPAALYSGLALPEPPQASRPLGAVTIALAAYGGRWPTSLVEWGTEEALPPHPTERGLQSGRAARRRRSQRDPLARSPAAPARIPPPAPPVSPTGKGHGEALTPPVTRETEHDQADQPEAARPPLTLMPALPTASWPTWSRVSARGASRGVVSSSGRASPGRGGPTANPTREASHVLLRLDAPQNEGVLDGRALIHNSAPVR